VTLTALDIFDPSSYPTRRDEEWKYSDLSRALREAPSRVDVSNTTSPVTDGAVTFFNGAYPDLNAIVDEGQNRIGLHQVAHPLFEEAFGGQSEAELTVPAGREITLFETYSGWEVWHDGVRTEKDERPYAANTTLHFILGEGARLTRVVILDEPEEAISIRRSTVETAQNSVFKQYVFSTGAKFQRFETHVTNAGHGAEVELNGAYLLKDKRHFDLTTRVTHAEINGVTAQIIRGLVKDSATAVFQGRILVERGADGTAARMRHQALILNDGAHVRAKPELEIYADDVQCAHGNTIGALDPEALFFCQSRGLSEEQARALLTHAFVLPVAEAIEDDDLRAKVLEFLEDKSEDFHAL